jgi:hypothetical protein
MASMRTYLAVFGVGASLIAAPGDADARPARSSDDRPAQEGWQDLALGRERNRLYPDRHSRRPFRSMGHRVGSRPAPERRIFGSALITTCFDSRRRVVWGQLLVVGDAKAGNLPATYEDDTVLPHRNPNDGTRPTLHASSILEAQLVEPRQETIEFEIAV